MAAARVEAREEQTEEKAGLAAAATAAETAANVVVGSAAPGPEKTEDDLEVMMGAEAERVQAGTAAERSEEAN